MSEKCAFNVRVDKEVKLELVKHAKQDERSLNWTANKALKEWLKTNKHKLEEAA